MTSSMRRIVVDRRRRRADTRHIRWHPPAVNGGTEFAEAVFGRPPGMGFRTGRLPLP